MKNKWTLADMPDLSGKVIIVTGGNGGLGFQAVKAFANKGAEVVIACRSDKKVKLQRRFRVAAKDTQNCCNEA